MFEPISKTWHFNSAVLWIDLALSVVLIALTLFAAINAAKRLSFTIASISLGSLCVVTWFFGLKFVWAITLVIMGAYLVVIFMQNQGEIKDFFSSFFFKRKSHKNAQKVYDRHAICQKVALAVETLSKTKTGALITFEKNTPLSDSQNWNHFKCSSYSRTINNNLLSWNKTP